ncbi:unnamed protein product [Merluccius merluccius]
MDPLRQRYNQFDVYETEAPSRISGGPGHGGSLVEELTLEHLQLLRDAFENHKTSSDRTSRRRPRKPQQDESRGTVGTGRRGGEAPRMDLEEFQKALGSVIGPDVSDGYVERFFREVDIDGEGLVDWPRLCSFLLRLYAERERSSTPRDAMVNASPLIKHCLHNKQETTVRVVAVPQPASHRYVSVSKGGRLIVWNSRLNILQNLGLSGDPAEEAVTRGSGFRGWTTDAVYMANVHKIAIATGCRDLRFINFCATSISEEVILFGFHNVPTALCYWYDKKSPEQRSLLLWGDDKGGVNLMWFLNPAKGLFENLCSEDDGPQRIYMPDLGGHSSLISYQHIPDVHMAAINRVLFEPEADLIMTSSESEETSVVIMHASLRRDPYIWKIDQDVYVRADMSWKSKGVHQSDILAVCSCLALGVVATASYDGEVIIWRVETQGPVQRLQRDTQTSVAPPVDRLLFLQHRAADRQWRNRAVLVSSQGGSLCFWSLAGHTQPHGEFYGPDRPGERVLSLGSNQLHNRILVSGDSAGCLQVWDISHYTLDIMQEPVCERPPPLLHRWRAHQGALVCTEVLELHRELLILSASTDGSARLWTAGGSLVGSFGQEVHWDVADPATYERGNKWEMEEENEKESDQSDTAKRGAPARVKGQTSDQQRICQHLFEDMEHQHRSRRLLFNIDLNKLFQAGTICSPYHTLVLQDCTELPLPEELPISPWAGSQSLRCSGGTKLDSERENQSD